MTTPPTALLQKAPATVPSSGLVSPEPWNTPETNFGKKGPYHLNAFFLNDANCYRRLARELSRWVASCMSPNNPNPHVPTDQEIQHQARWILYDDDDPWNQTAADNAEWLQRFKRDCGIIKDGPGLPDPDACNVKLGGFGFAPPYAFPRALLQQRQQQQQQQQLNDTNGAAAPAMDTGAFSSSCPLLQLPQHQQHHQQPQATAATTSDATFITALTTQDNDGNHGVVQGPLRDGPGLFPAVPDTASKWLQTFTQRYAAPATVFCSRELEAGLAEFVEQHMAAHGHDQGTFPSDAEMCQKAREILGVDGPTAADDATLLGKFKDLMRARLLSGSGPEEAGASATAMGTAEASKAADLLAAPATASQPQLLLGDRAGAALTSQQHPSGLPSAMDLTIPDNELNDILQDMQFQFDDGLSLQGNTATF